MEPESPQEVYNRLYQVKARRPLTPIEQSDYAWAVTHIQSRQYAQALREGGKREPARRDWV